MPTTFLTSGTQRLVIALVAVLGIACGGPPQPDVAVSDGATPDVPASEGSPGIDVASPDAAASDDVADLDSPYTTFGATHLGSALCRHCASLRCGADVAACAADPACVIAAECTSTCTDAMCVMHCGDAALLARAEAYSQCAFGLACRIPCFGNPEPRTTCGTLGQVCDPLIESIATCCDGQGMCPPQGGSCCRADGASCTPDGGVNECCFGSHCDAASGHCARTTCVSASGACTPGGMPCCDTGLACTSIGPVGTVCCGPDNATIPDGLPCCSSSHTSAGPGMQRCLPLPMM